MLPGFTSRWTRPGGGRPRGRRPPGRRCRRPGGRRAAPLLVEHVAQGRAPDELHDDGLDAAVAARVVDGDDVRVREPGGGHRLAAEAGDEGVVGGEVGEQDLHRHRPGQDLVVRLPDLGHAAPGQRAGRAGSDRRPGGRRLSETGVGTGSGTPGHRTVGRLSRSVTTWKVTPITRGPPWTPIVAPISPTWISSRGDDRRQQVEELRRRRGRCRAARRGSRPARRPRPCRPATAAPWPGCGACRPPPPRRC